MPEGDLENAKFVFVGEQPGAQEAKEGRPFVGPSGQLLERTLNRLGVYRQDVYLSNSVLCYPPGGDLDQFTQEHVTRPNEEIRKQNRKLSKGDRLDLISLPQEACRPHLRAAADTAAKSGGTVVTLGQLAYWSLTGKRTAVSKVRGSFSTFVRNLAGSRVGQVTEVGTQDADLLVGIPTIKIVPTINPAYALREAPYKEVLHRDIERAVRWAGGHLQWTDPNLISAHPSATLLADWLASDKGQWWSWDVESTGDGDLVNKLRTIGLYNLGSKEAIIVPWVSIDATVGFAGPTRRGEGPGVHPLGTLTLANPSQPDLLALKSSSTGWWENFEEHHYSFADGLRVIDSLYGLFTDSKRVKIGHYSGYFDHTVLTRHMAGLPSPLPNHIDQILLARLWNSELPRSLYFIGTMLTDVPAWKAAEDDRKIARDPRSAEELAKYNAIDVKVTAQTGSVLVRTAIENKAQPIVELDTGVQAVCREMHMLGLRVNDGVREELESKYRSSLEAERLITKSIGGEEVNPNSTHQLSKLFYQDWRLPIVALTDRGRPSVNEDAIRKLLTTPGILNKEQRAYIEALWRGRGHTKKLQVLKQLRQQPHGLVWPDGILRPHYSSHIPSTGRISSAKMNTQNIEAILRACIEPREGNAYVQADFDQIELRLMAGLAGVESYLEAFRAGSDPHAVTALLIYGDTFRRATEQHKLAPSKTDLFTILRRFAKTFVYAVLYGGTASTVHENVSKATDDAGNLLFPDMSFREVEASVNAWMRNAKEVPAWWNAQWEFADQNGYVIEPIMGRRRHMPAMLRNEAINHPIQGAAAIIMGQALLRVWQAFPTDYNHGWGVVNQMHDALTVEVPLDKAHHAAELLTERMKGKYPNIPVEFTAKGVATSNFAEAPLPHPT